LELNDTGPKFAKLKIQVRLQMKIISGPRLLSALLMLVTLTSLSQTFTPAPDKFIKEVSDMLGAPLKKEGRDLVEKEFAPVFNTRYSESQRMKIYETFNLMGTHKLRPQGEFLHYIHALIRFPESGRGQDGFKEWHAYLEEFMKNKKLKKFIDGAFESTRYLIEDNSFYVSPAVRWKASEGNWKLRIDSVPMVEFTDIDLICLAKKDSSVIRNTSGFYFPTTERWKGKTGRVTWERAGFNTESTYAEFKNYEIRIKSSQYVIDSVLFYNEFFPKPLLGKLTEKVQAGKDEETASYPRFDSYDKRLQIKNIFENIDYEGGFRMQGNKLAGSGTFEEPAILTIYNDKKPFLISRSLEYVIRPDRISAPHARIVFYVEKDSVYHPDIQLRYTDEKKQLVLSRTEEGLSSSPFTNTYHQVEMYFEALYWKLGDPMMELGNLIGSTQLYAAFESADYYKKARYSALMGISSVHPLPRIRDLGKKYGRDYFFANELAEQERLSIEQTHLMLIDLSNKGFVGYDMQTQFCTIKPKLYQTLEANAGKRDYDIIQFNSEVGKGQNAQLNLINYNMLIKGVKRINLSDSQKVTVLPANEEVLLKKNRDFKFGGRVFAGNLEFMGKDYYFHYDQFKIDLLSVDSCRIYVEDETGRVDQYGNKEKIRVKNVIEGITGTIEIDAPTNKSGVHKKDYPDYPIFTSSKVSFVYYDKKAIQKGQYKRDNFYYAVEPFKLKKISNFKRDEVKFLGTLVSGGIFPDIKEPLVIMDDYSLGFKKNTGGGGLAAYGGKAKFTSDITLDYNGLQGKGDFDFLTSNTKSDLFIFVPDSTHCLSTSFTNKESASKPEVPKVSCSEVKMSYVAGTNHLTATTRKEPMTFFNGESTMNGTIKLENSGMTGSGFMEFEGARLTSKVFDYRRRKILAAVSDFSLTSEGTIGIAFKTDNVNSDVDFDKREGLFKSNDDETKVEFPANQYMCYMDQFKWFMDKEQIEMSSSRQVSDDFVIDTDAEKKRSNFFSTHPKQDSLNFMSSKALYEIKESIIRCEKIKYIAVADSKVTPDEGKVTIYKAAKMETLTNATVLSNYVTQYHRIFNATLDIKGRNSYEGMGDYTYVDENKREFIIKIEKLRTDTSKQTIGTGKIIPEDEFFLSPQFAYQGNFTLKANDQHLTFKGGVQPMHNCEGMERNWLSFEAKIDPLEIMIPIDSTMADYGGGRLGAGVMITNQAPLVIYSSFLSKKANRKDDPILTATGFLQYDKSEKEFQIGSKEKLRQPKLPGAMLRFNLNSCEISGDGPMDFHARLGLIEFKPMGQYRNGGVSNEMEFKGTVRLNFHMDDGALKRMYEQINQWPGLASVDVGNTFYERTISEVLPQKESDKLISELNLQGQIKRLPDELNKTLYLADVTFYWNSEDQAFQSSGPIGIAHIEKRQLFRYVNGKIEIERRRSFDVLRVYLELDEQNWYYFEYKTEVMNVSSTDKDFMDILNNVKDDKRKIKVDGKNYSYLTIASKKKRDDFVSRFNDIR
jgi:hypothetical protein